jgi:hypothetical protein
MVGDQALRLSEQTRQLMNLSVTAGQLAQQRPPQRMTRQPEELLQRPR